MDGATLLDSRKPSIVETAATKVSLYPGSDQKAAGSWKRGGPYQKRTERYISLNEGNSHQGTEDPPTVPLNHRAWNGHPTLNTFYGERRVS
jgi:hypothetical protein